MARLPIEAAATSSAFSSGSPPASSVESVRMSWLVAYIRMRPPKYGRRSRTRSRTTPDPSLRSQYTTDATRIPSAEDDPEEVRADRGGHGEQDPRGERQLDPEALVEALELRDHPDEQDRSRGRPSSSGARSGRRRRRRPSSCSDWLRRRCDEKRRRTGRGCPSAPRPRGSRRRSAGTGPPPAGRRRRGRSRT